VNDGGVVAFALAKVSGARVGAWIPGQFSCHLQSPLFSFLNPSVHHNQQILLIL
jgi:hypothetical protein